MYLIGTMAFPEQTQCTVATLGLRMAMAATEIIAYALRTCEESEAIGQTDTEQKYCAHCDGGISEGPNEGDGSQFTCPECGGFFHRYRLGCHPDKFHADAEPPPCDHPDYGQEWRLSGWVFVKRAARGNCIIWYPMPTTASGALTPRPLTRR